MTDGPAFAVLSAARTLLNLERRESSLKRRMERDRRMRALLREEILQMRMRLTGDEAREYEQALQKAGA